MHTGSFVALCEADMNPTQFCQIFYQGALTCCGEPSQQLSLLETLGVCAITVYLLFDTDMW